MKWSPEHLVTLITEYPAKGAVKLAEELGRNVTAICKKASLLGLCAVFHKKQKLVPGKFRGAGHA